MPALPIARSIVTRSVKRLFSLVAVYCLLMACTPLVESDAAQREKAGSPRFVSLNPCLDAILVEVADKEQILALSHYSQQPGGSAIDPAVARLFPFTGGTAEEIIALQPDIVLASIFLSPATQSALQRAGLRVEFFDSPKNVTSSIHQVERMAQLVGKPEAAKPLVQAMKQPLLPPEKAGHDNPSVLLWQAGQIVAGQETLIAQLLKQEGFASYSAALGMKQADYVTLEQVLAAPPDLLLVAGDSAGQRHPSLRHLQSMQVYNFDPRLFYCGGPSIPRARSELHRLRMIFEKGSA